MDYLEVLAAGVVNPARAGGQTPIMVEILGRTFDTRRDVRVSDDEVWWEGPLDIWVEAVIRAAELAKL